MLPVQLITSCEGPLALNDNPFELCRDFIKLHGGRFFTQVSRYGDYLARFSPRPEYQPGDILKLILPFLKAHGLTNKAFRDFFSQNLRLLTAAEEAFKFLHRFGFPIFAVGSGYRQFAEAVGTRLGCAADHIIAAEVDLDRFAMPAAEAEELRRLAQEIVAVPDLELPPGVAEPADLPEPAREAIASMDRIFWERLPEMASGAILREVKLAGGAGKAQAVSGSLEKSGLKLADTIYVGDRAADVPAFEAVRAGSGLALSFNGDRDAVAAAEVVVVSDCAWPLGMLAAIFRLWGKDGILEVAAPETRAKSRALVLPEEMIEPIAMGLQGHTFNLYMSNHPNLEKIIQESETMQARLRGQAISTME